MVKLRVALAEQRDASYDIVIGRGLLADLPALVKAACPASRYVVITDSHVANLYVLGSLPPPQLAAGMAEAVKHGVIADRQYFDVLEQEHAAVTAREVS